MNEKLDMTNHPLRSPVETFSELAPATSPTPSDLVQRLETVEARAWVDFYRAAPETIKMGAGLGLHRANGLLVATATAFDALAFNRVLLRDGAIDADSLDDLLALCRRLGVGRFFIPWPPPPPRPGVEAMLRERGVRVHNRWVKLWRDAAPAPRVSSGLQVETLSREERGAFQSLMVACFDYPQPLGALFGATVGLEGWHHFGIRHGGRLVAAAGLRIRDDTAWFGPAATLPDFQRRGAQTTLLAHRVATALAAGCRLMCTETAEPTPEKPAPSFHNVRRAGFRIAYHRPNFVAVASTDTQTTDERNEP